MLFDEKLDEAYAEGNEKWKIDFYVPEAPREEVALLFIHGGGWAKGSKEQWSDVAKHFAQLGYMSASAGYRLTDMAVYPAQLEDVHNAMQYMKKQSSRFGFDPERIVVIGSSAGGYLAAMLALDAAYKESYPQAVILYCPVTTLEMNGDFIPQFMGCPWEGNEELYREASPYNRITGTELPFLIIQGDADVTTPYEQVASFHEALLESGVHSELEVLEGVGHGFGYGVATPAQQKSIQTIEAFLKAHFSA
ncbi:MULTISPECIES: alpha/beta hydrolase [unclassified Paenibacillus]|uniref:alpha/beta hydrolase n=1 Tax=unclassified Paenibacillus TaxID=185978 RepID=UPI00363AE399